MKIETKYDIGQEVWFMWNNKATHRKVTRVCVSKDGEGQNEEYSVKLLEDDLNLYGLTFELEDLFPSKEVLLKSL